MMNRVEKCMVAARRVWGFIWKECSGFRAPYYSWHPQMPCVHIITTLNWGFFSSRFLYLFPSSSSLRKFFLGWGGGCVIKRRPVVVGGARVVVSDALSKATLFGWTLQLCSSMRRSRGVWQICLWPQSCFIVDRGQYADLLNSTTHSLPWLFFFRGHRHFKDMQLYEFIFF